MEVVILKKLFIVVLSLLISHVAHASIQISEATSGAQYDALVKKEGASYIGTPKTSGVPVVSSSRPESAQSAFSAATSSTCSVRKPALVAANCTNPRDRFQKRFQEIKAANAANEVSFASSDLSDGDSSKISFSDLSEQYRSK